MDTVAGVFNSRDDAERAIQGLRSAGIAQERIAFLIPGTTDRAVEESVPTTDTEQSGMGTAMGGTVGGAVSRYTRRGATGIPIDGITFKCIWSLCDLWLR